MNETLIIVEEKEKKILTALIEGPKTWAELLELTGFARGTLAKYLKKLLEKGLITEEIDKRDRRVKRYKINEKGFEAIRIDLTAFLLYVGLMDSIKIKVVELKEKGLKSVKEENKLAYELFGNIVKWNDAENLRNFLIDLFGSLCLEAMTLGGDYFKVFCKIMYLLAPVLDLIYLQKDGEIIEFREFILERHKTLKETAGNLKIKDLEKIVERVKEVLKKDLMFHKTLLQAKMEVEKAELKPEEKKLILEYIEYMINVSKFYIERLKSSPFLALLCDSVAKELGIEV